MVISPKGASFNIDVKGLYKKNFWGVSEKPKSNSLFYVFAFVPDHAPNRFFVLTQAEVNAGVTQHIKDIKAARTAKGKSIINAEKFPGLPWDFVQKHENAWRKLPK